MLHDVTVDLAAALAEAQATWPGITVDPARFEAFVRERLPEGDAGADTLSLADLYLACALVDGDRAAVDAFEEHILDGVAPAVSRIDRDEGFARDIVGELRIKLLVRDEPDRPPRIARYLGRGPLRSWVQVAAIRAAYDRKRHRGIEEVSDEKLLDAPFADDPELRALRDESRALLKDVLSEALAELSARERTVLRLYLVEELSSEAIGRMYRVHRGTVARWIAGAHESLLSHVRRRLLTEKGLGPEHLASMLRLAGSQLSVSLSILLR